MQREHNERHGAGLGPLWFGFLGGAVAWTVQLNASYFTATLDCTTRTNLTLAVHLISLGALLVALAAFLVSWRNWRRTGTDEEPGVRTGIQRGGFMALFGLYADALFAVLIVFTGVTAFVLPRCAA